MSDPGALETATQASFDAASHLTDARFEGAKVALLDLARKIDGWDAVVRAAVEWQEERSDRRPAVPQHDNVSISAYYRALEALGLTPMSVAKLESLGENLKRATATPTKGATSDDDTDTAGPKRGKLTALDSLRGGVSAS